MNNEKTTEERIDELKMMHADLDNKLKISYKLYEKILEEKNSHGELIKLIKTISDNLNSLSEQIAPLVKIQTDAKGFTSIAIWLGKYLIVPLTSLAGLIWAIKQLFNK